MNIEEPRTLGGGLVDGFEFSARAQTVLQRARDLALGSSSGAVTSSCLLFAVTDTAGTVYDAARFLRDALEESGLYSEAYERFLVELRSRNAQSTAGATARQIASEDGRTVLESAAALAKQTLRVAF